MAERQTTRDDSRSKKAGVQCGCQPHQHERRYPQFLWITLCTCDGRFPALCFGPGFRAARRASFRVSPLRASIPNATPWSGAASRPHVGARRAAVHLGSGNRPGRFPEFAVLFATIANPVRPSRAALRAEILARSCSLRCAGMRPPVSPLTATPGRLTPSRDDELRETAARRSSSPASPNHSTPGLGI